MSIENRLARIERQLIPDSKVRKIHPPVIVTRCGRQTTPRDEQALGPVQDWITYQKQLQTQEGANAEYLKAHPGSIGSVITIDLDVDEEYRVRGGR